MDAALLLVAGGKVCPQIQASKHLFLPLLRSCLAEHHHFAEQGVLDDERCTNRLRSLWPIPERDFTSKLKLVVICSFNVNMPGDDMDNFKGGVTGGSILESMLRDRRQD